jgi:putative ABC transport system ATP-binding protein
MIDVAGLGKTYRNGAAETVALRDISLRVERGEFLAIMGPSGSGKSTLMHILGCLDAADTGTYSLDGRDVSGMTEADLTRVRRESIGFVFQSFNLLPRTTVLQNVIMPLLYTDVPESSRRPKAMDALRAAGFDLDHVEHLSNELSGGEMQRVAIARALINDPPILLADEPTGNLDSVTGEVILDTFADLNSQGRTIVLITHEPYVGEHAGRVVHLHDGRIASDTSAVRA